MSQARFTKLSWEILRHKVYYYKYNESLITDAEYDKLEIEYLKLCEELNKPNTLVHKSYPGVPEHINGTGMMEIDETKPSVQLVIDRIRKESANG